MSSEVKQVFEAMPGAFLPDKAGNVKALIQFNMTGQDACQWVVEVAEGKCQTREEAAPQPDVTVTMDANDYVALSRGSLDPMKAFMTGKIKVTGNIGLMMQLLQWFKRG
jgi:putative sterol carrier protein